MSAAAVILTPQAEFLESYTRCQPELLRDRYHRYQFNGEKPRPSITTITGKLDKSGPLSWAAAALTAERQVAIVAKLDADPSSAPEVLKELRDYDAARTHFDKVWKGKANIGSQFHMVAERYAQNLPLDQSVLLDEVRPRANLLYRFFEQLKIRIIATEFPVFSDTFWYAGAIDLAGILGIDPKVAPYLNGNDEGIDVLDYKTSESTFEARPGKPPIYPVEAWMQLMACAKADYIYDTQRGVKITMPRVRRIFSINVREDRIVLWQWPIEDVAWHGFIGCRAAWELEKRKCEPKRCFEILTGGKQ